MDLPLHFKELLAELALADVESVLVGGYAVAWHGRPRATRDVDLVLGGDADNLERAAVALASFGARGSSSRRSAVRRRRMLCSWVSRPCASTSCARSMASTRPSSSPAVHAEVDGVAIRVIALDDLITNKRAGGRPQDLIDADLLERVHAAKQRRPG